jgi:hypothetical protein
MKIRQEMNVLVKIRPQGVVMYRASQKQLIWMWYNKDALKLVVFNLHVCCSFEWLLSNDLRNGYVLDITLCDKVCQWHVAGLWFSPVSSNNKTDRHDITEILLKVALNTITRSLISLITKKVLIPGYLSH